MTKKVSLNRHLSPSPNQQNQTCPQRLKGQFALPMFKIVISTISLIIDRMQ